MDQDGQEEKPQIRSLFLRHRSPTFSKEEVQTLVKLIDKYKSVINNRSCNNATLQAKEVAWSKIAKNFNSQGFTHHRNVDCLKIKWVNLKKEAKKVSKIAMEDGHGDFDQLTSKVVAIMCESENSEISVPDIDDEYNEIQSDGHKDLKDDSVSWDENCDKEENKTNDTSVEQGESFIRFKNREKRSLNFTPSECRLLLQCVRPEKKYVFNKESSNRALTLKHRAWKRITYSYNKQSPRRRSTKMLWNKLKNMKKWAKQEDYNRLKDGKTENQKVKSEPVFASDDETDHGDSFGPEDDVASNSGKYPENNFNGINHNTENVLVNAAPDPLSIILNGDSGIGSINMDSFNSENSEVTKLKLELLKYQMENAKMERKRIEDAVLADANMSEARAIETALRLRTARLECIWASGKLPAGDPALAYTPQELRAQQYMDRYQPT